MFIQVLLSSRSQILAWNGIWWEHAPGQAHCLVQVHIVASLALCPCFIRLRCRWCSECRQRAQQRGGHGHQGENTFHIERFKQILQIFADLFCGPNLRHSTAAKLVCKTNLTTSAQMDLKLPFWIFLMHDSQVGNEHFLYHPLQELFSLCKEIPERHASVSWSWAISPWKDSMNPDESRMPGKAL